MLTRGLLSALQMAVASCSSMETLTSSEPAGCTRLERLELELREWPLLRRLVESPLDKELICV